MDKLISRITEADSLYMSTHDIDEALLLPKEGGQRLRPVSETEATFFYFCTTYSGHHSAAEIRVIPVANGDGKHPFYKPALRYILCCDEAPEERFKEQYQAVYDARIRPIQWTFHDDGVRVPLSVQALPSACHERSEPSLKSLVETRITAEISQAVQKNDRNSTFRTGDRSRATPLCEYRQIKVVGTAPKARRRQRQSSTELVGDNSGAAGAVSPPKKKPRPARTDEEIAKSIAQRIIRALEDVGNTAGKIGNIAELEDARPRILSETDDNARFELFRQLADSLWTYSQSAHDDLTSIKWANRFYSSCMRFILRNRRQLSRDDSKDRAADSTQIINLAVDALSASADCNSGTKPACDHYMMLYTALAKLNHSISELGGKGKDRRSKFSELLASELHGKLPQIPSGTPIFHPAAVISWLWHEPYKSICKELGLVNVASLDEPGAIFKVYGLSAPMGHELANQPYTYAIPHRGQIRTATGAGRELAMSYRADDTGSLSQNLSRESSGVGKVTSSTSAGITAGMDARLETLRNDNHVGVSLQESYNQQSHSDGGRVGPATSHRGGVTYFTGEQHLPSRILIPKIISHDTPNPSLESFNPAAGVTSLAYHQVQPQQGAATSTYSSELFRQGAFCEAGPGYSSSDVRALNLGRRDKPSSFLRDQRHPFNILVEAAQTATTCAPGSNQSLQEPGDGDGDGDGSTENGNGNGAGSTENDIDDNMLDWVNLDMFPSSYVDLLNPEWDGTVIS